MATLNLSTNGSSISKTYQSIIDSPLPTGSAGSSSTYGQWALYSVSAPLANAFKPESASSESILKVETTGAGELDELIEEFSDGRIQFGFVKVKDPNTTLAKYVLIGWCGEGVPERTKGYFTSHLAAASKVLRGYHVQVTARSDRDLTAESIVQKVADASGSKYSAPTPSAAAGPPPPIASKPVFNPTRTVGGGSSFNPLATSRQHPIQFQSDNVDKDGWGDDAPPVTRTQLEKVQSAYQPTKVNMSELTRQKEEPSRFASRDLAADDNPHVVKGEYQPVGKVDIAAIRRQAQASGTAGDERPTMVKGSYEPVGKVDIAAIRARAQPPSGDGARSAASGLSPAATGSSAVSQDSADRSSSFTQSERLTSLPKPKIGNKFGSSTSTFTGTKPPAPSGFGLDSKPSPAAPAVGAASRTFADEGGKTPAQIWAEKKARERGLSGTSDNPPTIGAAPLASQRSGGEEWKSGYSGKSWAPVKMSNTGRSAGSGGMEQQTTGEEPLREEEGPTSPTGGVSAIRDRFKGAAPMGAAAVSSSFTGDRSNPSPPPLATASKPNAGAGARAIPGLPRPVPAAEEEKGYRMPTPPAVPRSPTPPTPPSMRPSSPIRVAMPVGRGHGEAPMSPPEERFSPHPVPVEALSAAVPRAQDLTEEPSGHDPARGAGMAAAAASFPSSTPAASSGAGHGPRALVQYDYEKAEDNEIDLVEGQYVHNVDMVDDDWWMVTNERGETGLVPANYLELAQEEEAPTHAEPAPTAAATATATAIYDYEAAEDNELSFPEGATITDIEFPDEDWWSGAYHGKQALFPASYVELNK